MLAAGPRRCPNGYADALGLWRGPALADVSSAALSGEAARLDELRLLALDRRIDADLALGRHLEIVPELEALAIDEPLREGPRRHLMLALYRSGRQADALRLYRQTRELLADQLGLDPSPRLQALEVAILNQSPDLDAPASKNYLEPLAELAPDPSKLPARPGASSVPTLPGGTVVLMFSDIERSTDVFRARGADYATVLQRHRAVVDDAVSEHGGWEVHTERDGRCFAFDGLLAAIRACVDAQRSLAIECWPDDIEMRARMGIHTGEVAPDSASSTPLAVYQAAEVETAAHGGQILVSEAAAATVGGLLPPPAELRDLGPWRIKHFTGPIRLFMVGHPDLVADFPPPQIDSAPSRASRPARRERRAVTVVSVELAMIDADRAVDPEVHEVLVGSVRGDLERILADAGGHVVTGSASEVVALFGAPRAWGNDPQRAVRAAQACAHIGMSGDDLHVNVKAVQVRVGVQSGDALIDISDDGATVRAVAGDVFRQAARLRSSSPNGQVLVGDETRRAAHAGFVFEPAVALDGSGCWLVTASILAASDDGALLGRADELAQLDLLWQRAACGRAQFVTVLGPPGIGKTRLAKEFCLTRPPPAVIFEGRSMPSISVGYRPFREQLRVAAHIGDDDDRIVRLEKLTAFVSSLLPEPDAADATAHLGALLGVGEEGTGDRQLLFHSFRRLVDALGRDLPVLLVFDDVHWADRSTLDLLDWLAARVRDARVMFLVLGRPELLDQRPTWGGGQAAVTTIHLEGLDDQSAALLIGHQPEGAGGAAHTARVIQTAGGNPLFLLELAATDASFIRGDSTPATIASAIAARLDALSPQARAATTAAAVVGPVFWSGAVQAQGDLGNLDAVLDLLETRGFVRRLGTGLGGQPEYEFRHILIRDAAYRLLPRARARRPARQGRPVHPRHRRRPRRSVGRRAGQPLGRSRRERPSRRLPHRSGVPGTQRMGKTRSDRSLQQSSPPRA